MIKLLLISAFLNTAEIQALPPEPPKQEARKRGKGQRGRRRGGSGLR